MMRKDELKKLIKPFKDNSHVVYLALREFVKAKKMKKRKGEEHISFWEFLACLRKIPNLTNDISQMLSKPSFARNVLKDDPKSYQTGEERVVAHIINRFLDNEMSVNQPRFFGNKKLIIGMNTSCNYNAMLVEIAAWACFEFRKGSKQFQNSEVSILCKLPKDVLKLIFEFVFPFANMTTHIFVEKKPKQVFLSELFVNRVFEIKFPQKHCPVNLMESKHEKRDKKCCIM